MYCTSRSNRVADALSQRPTDLESEDEYSDTDSDDYHAISHSAVCDAFNEQLSSTKIPNFVKHGVQIVSEGLDEIEESSGIKAIVNSVTVFDQLSPTVMAEHQHYDNQLSTVYENVEMGKSPPKNVIYKSRYKTSHKLLLQFDRLTLKQGVLHRLYTDNDTEYHQLVLLQRYQDKVLKSLHDNMGHQGLQCTLSLLCEHFYWPTMAQDASDWVTNCHHCCVSKGIIQVHIHNKGV